MVLLSKAKSAHSTSWVEWLCPVNYLPGNCVFNIFVFQFPSVVAQFRTVGGLGSSLGSIFDGGLVDS